jgi:hypothetical protein
MAPTISSIWNGSIQSRNGQQYMIAAPSWSKAVPVGGTVSFGFTAAPGNFKTLPTDLVMRDASVPSPTPAPTATPTPSPTATPAPTATPVPTSGSPNVNLQVGSVLITFRVSQDWGSGFPRSGIPRSLPRPGTPTRPCRFHGTSRFLPAARWGLGLWHRQVACAFLQRTSRSTGVRPFRSQRRLPRRPRHRLPLHHPLHHPRRRRHPRRSLRAAAI